MVDVAATARRGTPDWVVALWQRTMEHDVLGLSAELAYRFFFAALPTAVMVAATGTIIANAIGGENPAEEMVDLLGDQLPENLASRMESEASALFQTRAGLPLLLGSLGAVWASAVAMWTVVKALNRVYEVEERRPLLRRVGVVLLMVASMGLAFAAALALIVAGELGVLGPFTRAIFLPAVLVLGGIGTALGYWMAPNRDSRLRWASIGSAISTVLWIVGTVVFVWVLGLTGGMNNTYGSLTGALLFLSWLYLSAFAFLFGAEIDAYLADSK